MAKTTIWPLYKCLQHHAMTLSTSTLTVVSARYSVSRGRHLVTYSFLRCFRSDVCITCWDGREVAYAMGGCQSLTCRNGLMSFNRRRKPSVVKKCKVIMHHGSISSGHVLEEQIGDALGNVDVRPSTRQKTSPSRRQTTSRSIFL
jgi:hypothetical protein